MVPTGGPGTAAASIAYIGDPGKLGLGLALFETPSIVNLLFYLPH